MMRYRKVIFSWKRAFDCAVEWQKKQTPYSEHDIRRAYRVGYSKSKLNEECNTEEYLRIIKENYPEQTKQ